MTPIKNTAVAHVFASYPANVRVKLMALRELILNTAAKTKGVGEIEETLKWGEPAYLTSETKSGSTIRIAWKKSKPDQYAMYFNCNTNLIERFRTRFRNTFHFEGNRAIVFETSDIPDTDALALCIAETLTYHQR
jgi:Domain of unknown function (DU1801)